LDLERKFCRAFRWPCLSWELKALYRSVLNWCLSLMYEATPQIVLFWVLMIQYTMMLHVISLGLGTQKRARKNLSFLFLKCITNQILSVKICGK
jgi:hypothetical protein